MIIQRHSLVQAGQLQLKLTLFSVKKKYKWNNKIGLPPSYQIRNPHFNNNISIGQGLKPTFPYISGERGS